MPHSPTELCAGVAGRGDGVTALFFKVTPVLPITGRIPLRLENALARRPEIRLVLVPRHWDHDALLQTSEMDQYKKSWCRKWTAGSNQEPTVK